MAFHWNEPTSLQSTHIFHSPFCMQSTSLYYFLILVIFIKFNSSSGRFVVHVKFVRTLLNRNSFAALWESGNLAAMAYLQPSVKFFWHLEITSANTIEIVFLRINFRIKLRLWVAPYLTWCQCDISNSRTLVYRSFFG